MAQQLTPEHLERLLRQADFNMSKVAFELGISPQRVKQLCESLGVRIVKDVVLVEPTKKSLLYGDRKDVKP